MKIKENSDTVKNTLKRFYRIRVDYSGLLLDVSPELEVDIGKASIWLTSDRMKHSLIIAGDNGNGKTTLANSMCDVMESRLGIFPTRVESHEFADMYASGATPHEQELAKEKYDRLKNCKILFIDDVGKESPEFKCWGTSFKPIERILVWRYERHKPTIITTNCTPEELSTRYGTHVVDRFHESYNRIVISRTSYR